MRWLLMLVMTTGTTITLAATSAGIGGVATNLMAPVTVFAEFIHSACLLLGGSFVFASVIKYFEHRRSPLMTPISTVIFLFIMGIILLALPLLSYINESAVPYQLIRS